MKNETLEKWVWALIYGGLLTASFGIFLQARDPLPGWALITGGSLAVVVGVVLIFVRARRRD